MENLPGPMASQWSRWGRHKDYLFSEIKSTESVYSQIKSNITSFSIADDEFAPRKAVEWMLSNYPNAKTKSIHLIPKENGLKKIGHFGIFKKRNAEALWPILLSEIDSYGKVDSLPE
jgi:predicted alpha/beta hydrolase